LLPRKLLNLGLLPTWGIATIVLGMTVLEAPVTAAKLQPAVEAQWVWGEM